MLEHVTFTHVFDRAHIFSTIGPAWYLANEVIYYAVAAGFGALAYRVGRRLGTWRARLAWLGIGIGGVVAASLAYKWWAFYVAQVPAADYPVYFGPAARLDGFAFGMLLASAVAAARGRPRLRGAMPALLRLAGLGLIVGSFALRDTHSAVGLHFHTLAGLACALVLAATVLGPRGSTWERVAAHPLLQLLGMVSYSVYLWHEPLLVELSRRHILVNPAPEAFPSNTLVLVGVSVAVAAASYWGVERPAMYLRYLFTPEGAWSGGTIATAPPEPLVPPQHHPAGRPGGAPPGAVSAAVPPGMASAPIDQ